MRGRTFKSATWSFSATRSTRGPGILAGAPFGFADFGREPFGFAVGFDKRARSPLGTNSFWHSPLSR